MNMEEEYFEKQYHRSVIHNPQNLYCNLVFIARFGIYYTAQLHVVDVNINLDLYKCNPWIHHTNESFPKIILPHAFLRFSLAGSCSNVSCCQFSRNSHVPAAFCGHRIVTIKSSHASVVSTILGSQNSSQSQWSD